MFEPNTFVHSNPNRVIFPHEMKIFPLMTLLLHYVIRDGVATSHVTFHWFTWIGSHFRAKKQKFCMFEPNRFVHCNPNRVNFSHKMKIFPGIALLLQYVIWDGVMTSHVTFHWFRLIGSHFRAKNRNSVWLSTRVGAPSASVCKATQRREVLS